MVAILDAILGAIFDFDITVHQNANITAECGLHAKQSGTNFRFLTTC